MENKDNPKLAGELRSYLNQFYGPETKDAMDFIFKIDLSAWLRDHGQEPLEPFNIKVVEERIKYFDGQISRQPEPENEAQRVYFNSKRIVNEKLKQWIQINKK